MRKVIRGFGTGTVVGLLIVVGVARGEEEKVGLEKAPKGVVEAVKARFKGAEVRGTSKETEEGKVVYEVTIKHQGHNIDVTVTPEGEIVLFEREIAAKELPKRVSKALEGGYPKATYKRLEQIYKVEKKQEKLTYYEALLVTAEKKLLEVQVTEEGKVVNEEEKKGSE